MSDRVIPVEWEKWIDMIDFAKTKNRTSIEIADRMSLFPCNLMEALRGAKHRVDIDCDFDSTYVTVSWPKGTGNTKDNLKMHSRVTAD